MKEDIESFIDDSPLPGINLLPVSFDMKTIIEKQEKEYGTKIPHKKRQSPRLLATNSASKVILSL